MNKIFINVMSLKQNTKGNVFQNTASDFVNAIEIPDSFLVELTLTIIALNWIIFVVQWAVWILALPFDAEVAPERLSLKGLLCLRQFFF